ncbi:MAG TPA: CHASE2 domain-containing protein, partial [Candidatus Dormibacteraeota bacterium]|nr:CHASE2 domain-containing protein [Candidatus Dormibacteraeota bacterium]
MKRVPALIAFGVITFVCLLRLLHWNALERVECMTYDARARQALKASPPAATNLGFIAITEESVKKLWDGSVGFNVGLYWPRQVYGRLVQELADQGAKAVAFDILFGELRPDQQFVLTSEGAYPTSDEYFAGAMKGASNVIIAVTKEVTPPLLFVTNAMALGDITTEKDADGILRRVQVFKILRNWHPIFQDAEEKYGVDLMHARVERHQIITTNSAGEQIRIPLDTDGDFDLAAATDKKLPAGAPSKAKPFTEQRVWHMGVVLAAKELQLDLRNPEVNLDEGYIILRGPKDVVRKIPVDREGYCYVDWALPPNDPRLTQEAIQDLLLQKKLRLEGKTEGLTNRWR